MEQKINQVVSFLQGKSASVTIAEINQICQILNSCIEPKPNETGTESKKNTKTPN